MVELACETPDVVPFWVVEAAVVADASAGLKEAMRPGVVPAAGAAAVVAVPEAAAVAPPNKPGVVAVEVAGAAAAGVAPKRGFAAAGALVVVELPPNKPPGLEVAAPPKGLAAAELAGTSAPVAGAVSFALAPNIEPAVLEAGAAWEP